MTYPSITKLLRLFTIICLFFLVFLFITRYLSILIPIFLVLSCAMIMEPYVVFLEKKLKFPRPLAAMTILILLLVVFIACFYLVVTEIYDGILYLSKILPTHMQDFGEFYDFYSQPIGMFIATITDFFDNWGLFNVEEQLSQLFSAIASMVSQLFESFLRSIPEGLAYIPDSFTLVVFMFLATFLLSADFPLVKSKLEAFIPERMNKSLKEMKNYLKGQAFGYLRGQLILITLTFMLLFLGLSALKVNHALTIAFMLFLIDLIPFIGTGIVLIPWMLYCFITADYFLTIGLASLYMLIIITRQLLEPKILASQMQIHPLLWLFAAYIGYKVQGLFGLLLAPYLLVFIKGLYEIGIITSLIDYIKKDEK